MGHQNRGGIRARVRVYISLCNMFTKRRYNLLLTSFLRVIGPHTCRILINLRCDKIITYSLVQTKLHKVTGHYLYFD